VYLESYAKTHRSDWQRLDDLASHRTLHPTEVDELVELYGRASTHLSIVQVQDPDGPYANRLSLIIARARSRLTSATGSPVTGLKQFFAFRLPYAPYQIRWLTIILGGVFLAIALAYGLWYGSNPQMFDAMMSESAQAAYVNDEFVDYYSEN